MSALEEEVTGEVEADATEANEENSIGFSSDLVNERVKASLGPLHAQISALIEMMDRLIQSNSVKEATTASSLETRHQFESPYTGVRDPLDSRQWFHLPPRDTRPTTNVFRNRHHHAIGVTFHHLESNIKRRISSGFI